MRRARSGERATLPLGVLAGGTVAAIALAILAGVLLPIRGAALGAGAPGDPRVYTKDALQGRKLFIREGCFTCHSMEVRDAASDGALGPRISEAGDYLNEAPSLIGEGRIGPDLTCVGDRESDMDWHVRHLRRPASVRKSSNMPSYGYLTAGELRALASFLLSLKCEA